MAQHLLVEEVRCASSKRNTGEPLDSRELQEVAARQEQ
jgi:hypothetical protein